MLQGSTGSSLIKIVAVPNNLALKKKRTQAVNAKANCITVGKVLEELKHQKEEKEAREEDKRIQKLWRESTRNHDLMYS